MNAELQDRVNQIVRCVNEIHRCENEFPDHSGGVGAELGYYDWLEELHYWVKEWEMPKVVCDLVNYVHEQDMNGLPCTNPRPAAAVSSLDRKKYPMFSGLLKYFPDALMYVAHVSFVGNEQHNPGEPLHWAREKSTDEPDALLRHLKDAGAMDTDGLRHTGKVAWRALAMLQKEIESALG